MKRPWFQRPALAALLVSLVLSIGGIPGHATATLDYEYLGGNFVGSPVTIARANRVDNFIVGSDHAIYRKYFDGTAWFPTKQSFENLSGYSLSDPIAVSWTLGRVDLFMVGADHALYHKYTNNVSSSFLPSETGYENLGGIIVGRPSVIAPSYGRLDVFIVGTDQTLYHKYFSAWSAAGWQPSTHGFENLGGHLSGTPQATEGSSTPLYVVAKGIDQAAYDKYYDGANRQPSVSAWEHLGGQVLGDVSASTGYFDAAQRVDLFVVGTDHALYHEFEIGNVWYSQF